jgi:uncharacterized protein
MSAEFPIPIADLDAGGRELRFVVRAAWVRGALEDSGATAAGTDGALEVRVSKSGNDVVVHGRLVADLTVPCARCLEDVSVHLDHPVTALMVPASELRRQGDAAGERELNADDLDVLPYSGDTLELDDLVRDELVLEVPMIPLCSEDCTGITAPPAAADGGAGESPLDPRLAPLLRLKKMHEKKE